MEKTQAESLKKIINTIKTKNAARTVIGVLLFRHGPEFCAEVSEFVEALRVEFELCTPDDARG
jgi:hypothetical protein